MSCGAALGPTATARLFAAESMRGSVHKDFLNKKHVVTVGWGTPWPQE